MLIKIAALAAITIILCIGIFFKDKIKYFSAILTILIPAYFAVLAWFTLISRSDINASPSFVPFSSYLQIISVRWYGWGEYLFGAIFGNILLFVPIGLMTATIQKSKHPYLVSGVIGFALSVTIEIIQYTAKIGIFEADDIINNTWGAVIGCSVALMLFRKDKRLSKNIRTLTSLIVHIGITFTVCIVPIMKELFR